MRHLDKVQEFEQGYPGWTGQLVDLLVKDPIGIDTLKTQIAPKLGLLAERFAPEFNATYFLQATSFLAPLQTVDIRTRELGGTKLITLWNYDGTSLWISFSLGTKRPFIEIVDQEEQPLNLPDAEKELLLLTLEQVADFYTDGSNRQLFEVRQLLPV